MPSDNPMRGAPPYELADEALRQVGQPSNRWVGGGENLQNHSVVV